MTLTLATDFFMWCTIINGVLFLISTAMVAFAPNFVYAMQSKFFTLPRDAFNVMIYGFLGLYKVFFITFNVVPYLALLLIG